MAAQPSPSSLFTEALAGTSGGGRDPRTLPDDLMEATVAVMPCDWAGIALITQPRVAVPVGVSDAIAAAAERTQFTVAEGPCLEASRTGRTVLVPDVTDTTGTAWQRWPLYASEVTQHTPIRGIFSIPINVGEDLTAVLGLYSGKPAGDVLVEVIAEAHAIAGRIHSELAGTAETSEEGRVDFPWLDTPAVRLRRMIWLAAGMTTVEAEVDVEAALAVLRARAYASGRSLDEVARDVLTGRITPADLDL